MAGSRTNKATSKVQKNRRMRRILNQANDLPVKVSTSRYARLNWGDGLAKNDILGRKPQQ